MIKTQLFDNMQYILPRSYQDAYTLTDEDGNVHEAFMIELCENEDVEQMISDDISFRHEWDRWPETWTYVFVWDDCGTTMYGWVVSDRPLSYEDSE